MRAASVLGFRGFKSTAPLKHRICQDADHAAGRFRGFKSTAPLKPGCSGRPSQNPLRFPWIQIHGPIEACFPDVFLRPLTGVSVDSNPRPH